MSKIFPDGKMEEERKGGGGGGGGGAGESDESKVKEQQAKKYLEGQNDEDEEENKKHKNAWLSPRKNEAKNDTNTNTNAEEKTKNEEERKRHHHHRHHHHHHHHKDKDKDRSKNESDSHSSNRKHRDDNTNNAQRDPDSDSDERSNGNDSQDQQKDLESGTVTPSPEGQEPPAPPIEKTQSYVEAVDLLFRRAKNDVDALSQYMPLDDNDPVLTTITEILFKPYARPLKLFAVTFWLCQFATLIALFWSMLPCPNQTIDWSVVVGLPLCCGYGGIESFHEMLRFVHLRKKFPFLVTMVVINAILQLLCVGVVMGKSIGLLDLVSNFIGVAIVLQVDELLAQYIKIKDTEPKLLSTASWKTKMLLSSKLILIFICGVLVYIVTLAVWYTDRWTCWNSTGSHAR